MAAKECQAIYSRQKPKVAVSARWLPQTTALTDAYDVKHKVFELGATRPKEPTSPDSAAAALPKRGRACAHCAAKPAEAEETGLGVAAGAGSEAGGQE